MRILQLITLSELGGAQSVVANLSNSLCADHEVIVAAGEGDGKLWKMLDPRVKQVKCMHLRRAISPWNDFIALIDLLCIYLKYKPDIIHLHSSKAGMLGRVAFPSKKIIYTVHGFDSIRLAFKKFLPIERLMQKACKAIVGVSLYDERNLQAERINRHVSCIYNGIYPPKSLEGNPFLDIKGFKAKVLCVARLSPQKGVGLFIDIARSLPEYAFIWIGNQHAVEEDLPANVFFMGNLPNAGAYNAYADLFILPSNYEGLPMVIIEAMSLGKPVVASNVGGIGEIVINDRNGYVVDNTVESFRDKIQYILENSEIYNRFSTCAKKQFVEKLTVEKMTTAYLKVYRS